MQQNPGQFKISSSAILWKKQGDDNDVIQLDKPDIIGVAWMKLPVRRTNQLAVRAKEYNGYYRFRGFSDQDVISLTEFFQNNYGITPQTWKPSTTSRNAGHLDLSGNSTSSDKDRFSSLPIHVAHHVLSFLSIEDIAKLSFTSKTLKVLCSSVPSLIINTYKLTFPRGSVQRVQFMNFLVRFLRSHQGTEMTSLYIVWPTDNESSHIMSWLNHALRCHVKEIELYLDHRSGIIVVPLYVFCCESLRSLTIELREGRGEFNKGKLKLLTPPGFSSRLKYLHLANLEIVDESLGSWISTSCKFLEKLELEEIFGIKKFKISSPSLLAIKIELCCFEDLNISAQLLHSFLFSKSCYASTSLNIHAPNLLCYSGSSFDSLRVEKKSESNYYVELFLFRTCPGGTNELQLNIVQVTDLAIDINSIQVLHKKKCLPFAAKSLQSLVLFYEDLTESTFPATYLFLQRFAHSLRKLHMTHNFLEDDVHS
ncbi:hypothetical protein ACFE04_028034 [Oxalis oulophora]